MSRINPVLGLKSLEKLLHEKGFLICQQTGEKITQEDNLVAVHLTVDGNECVILPVHKDNANIFLQTMIMSFLDGPPTIDEDDSLEYKWHE
jgi:hypothetical protein